MCARCRKPFIVLSIVLMAIIAALWVMSLWRTAGWRRYDEQWVLPGSGMQELHTTGRMWCIVQGRFEAARVELLRAVIPAGSSAAREAEHESHWAWQPVNDLQSQMTVPQDRWHLLKWDDWRMGDFGWYRTGAPGSAYRVFSVPLWMVMAVVGTPCWIGLARAARSQRRRRRGWCVRCGYDRRGIAIGSACPECGAALIPVKPRPVVAGR